MLFCVECNKIWTLIHDVVFVGKCKT